MEVNLFHFSNQLVVFSPTTVEISNNKQFVQVEEVFLFEHAVIPLPVSQFEAFTEPLTAEWFYSFYFQFEKLILSPQAQRTRKLINETAIMNLRMS